MADADLLDSMMAEEKSRRDELMRISLPHALSADLFGMDGFAALTATTTTTEVFDALHASWALKSQFMYRVETSLNVALREMLIRRMEDHRLRISSRQLVGGGAASLVKSLSMDRWKLTMAGTMVALSKFLLVDFALVPLTADDRWGARSRCEMDAVGSLPFVDHVRTEMARQSETQVQYIAEKKGSYHSSADRTKAFGEIEDYLRTSTMVPVPSYSDDDDDAAAAVVEAHQDSIAIKLRHMMTLFGLRVQLPIVLVSLLAPRAGGGSSAASTLASALASTSASTTTGKLIRKNPQPHHHLKTSLAGADDPDQRPAKLVRKNPQPQPLCRPAPIVLTAWAPAPGDCIGASSSSLSASGGGGPRRASARIEARKKQRRQDE